MARPKRLKVAVLTFTAALGSGLIMQYGDALASRWGVDAPVTGPDARLARADVPLVPVKASAAAPQLRSMMTGPTPETATGPVAVVPADLRAPRMSDFSATSAQADRAAIEDAEVILAGSETTPAPDAPAADIAAEPEVELAAVEDAPMEDAPIDEISVKEMEAPGEDQIVLGDACDMVFTATGAPLASVALDLMAPCHGDMPVVIHHQGMMFHAITDDNGRLQIEVPALAEEAFFIAAFDDGEGAVAITGVPEVALYDRAVLQWQGTSGVQLHAREFGATYGSDGHVWAKARGQIAEAMDGSGGVLTQLGDPAVLQALQAEVYTFPSGYVAADGAVDLTVEAEVTAMNCGRDISAQSIQIEPGAEAAAIDLTMTMPGCDSIGEFLILNNMFQDLTLAAR